MDLAKEVDSDKIWSWSETEWSLGEGYERKESRFKVVAWDYGVKLNILRMLASRGCDITVVPAQTPASEVLAMNPDGIFLSNGPVTPSPAITPSPPSRKSWKPRSRCLAFAGAPAAGPGQRCENHEDGPWPPRRQPSGAGYRQGYRDD